MVNLHQALIATTTTPAPADAASTQEQQWWLLTIEKAEQIFHHLITGSLQQVENYASTIGATLKDTYRFDELLNSAPGGTITYQVNGKPYNNGAHTDIGQYKPAAQIASFAKLVCNIMSSGQCTITVRSKDGIQIFPFLTPWQSMQISKDWARWISHFGPVSFFRTFTIEQALSSGQIDMGWLFAQGVPLNRLLHTLGWDKLVAYFGQQRLSQLLAEGQHNVNTASSTTMTTADTASRSSDLHHPSLNDLVGDWKGNDDNIALKIRADGTGIALLSSELPPSTSIEPGLGRYVIRKCRRITQAEKVN